MSDTDEENRGEAEDPGRKECKKQKTCDVDDAETTDEESVFWDFSEHLTNCVENAEDTVSDDYTVSIDMIKGSINGKHFVLEHLGSETGYVLVTDSNHGPTTSLSDISAWLHAFANPDSSPVHSDDDQ